MEKIFKSFSCNDQKIWIHKALNCFFFRENWWNENRLTFNKSWSRVWWISAWNSSQKQAAIVSGEISECNELTLYFYAGNIKINCQIFFAFTFYVSFEENSFCFVHFLALKKARFLKKNPYSKRSCRCLTERGKCLTMFVNNFPK